MEELIKTIEKLSEKNIVDYLFIGVPILISVVAIFISIATARKQNKIALFERRFKCLSQMQMVFTFAGVIKGSKDYILILQLFDAYWGTDASLHKGNLRAIKTKSQLMLIVDEIVQSKFLFKCKYTVSPVDLASAFHSVVIGCIGENVTDDMTKKIEELCNLCDEFKKKDYPELEKQTKIK